MGERIGSELGRNAAPGEAETRPDDRERCGRAAGEADEVGQHRKRAQPNQHERHRLVVGVRFAARRRAQRHPDDSQCDRRNGDLLTPARVLAEHAASEHEQHQEPGGERGLHDHQRREPQRQHLQRPSADRKAGAEQPAWAHRQVASQAKAQVHVMWGALGIPSLQRHP